MDDLISRQAAIDLVRDVCDAVMSGCESWYDPETGDEVYKDIREVDAILKCNKEVRIALRNMSSAERHGKWIHDGYDFPHGVDWMHCSECGKSDVYCPATRTNFCPNCGARMDGEHDG